MTRNRFLPLALLLIPAQVLPTRMPAQSQATITVEASPKQEFMGMGFSIHRGKTSYLPANATTFNRLYDETFAAFNTMVFWSYIEDPVPRDQIIATATQRGLEHIIVNTTGEPQTPQEHAQVLFGEIHEYLSSGYPIYGTTLMNKPNTDESDTKRQTPAFLTELAILLRHKLDSAGYAHIKIGGPSTIEWAPYMDPVPGGAAHGYSFQPGDNRMYLQAFLDDSVALAALDAIDFQSYGWSIDTAIQRIAHETGKELWVTLAATDGFQNNNGDPILAPILAANCLANINHGVKSWNTWVWDQLLTLSTATPSLRLKYFQQIAPHFPKGSSVRTCRADSLQVSEDLFWNYYNIPDPTANLQPEVVAAAALSPDSMLSVAVVNLTGIHAQHFFSTYVAAEATPYSVEVFFEELAATPSITASPTLVANNGNVTSLPDVNLVFGRGIFSVDSKNMVLIQTDLKSAVALNLNKDRQTLAIGFSPNPVQHTGKVVFDLAQPALVTAEVFDLTGRYLGQLASESSLAAGPQHIPWNPDPGLANGMYVIRVKASQPNGQMLSGHLRVQILR